MSTRPRRVGVWCALAVLLLLAAAAVASLSQPPSEPLSTTSTAPDGSKAAAAVLAHFGATVHATSSLSDALSLTRGRDAHNARNALVVTGPADYSDPQLREMRAAPLLVLIRPDAKVLTALDSATMPDPVGGPASMPGCTDASAQATGKLHIPDDALAYTAAPAATSCYDGLLVEAPRLTIIGSVDVLRNDHLGAQGDAAFVVNSLTRGRAFTSVVWLRPGADAAGSGAATVWDLFPPGVQRAFWWCSIVVVLIVLWRGRRLGSAVQEPLPVVVRAAEVVEGHGRLYHRAGARDRAAYALRSATALRLRTRLGLPREAEPAQVAYAAAVAARQEPDHITQLLAGPTPSDDAALRRLANELAALEAVEFADGRPVGSAEGAP